MATLNGDLGSSSLELGEDKQIETSKIQDPRSKLLVIVGPTASGKSALALDVAERYNGEIICADSQTIRRGMNIGTAKPSRADQKRVRHHLLDIVGPYEKYSAAQFKQDALKAIEDIQGRGKLPILVGGTGLYVDAVIFDFSFADPPDPHQRAVLTGKSIAELHNLHRTHGVAMPFNSLNKRHLVRSLETGGLKAPDKTLRPNTLVIGLNPSTAELTKRIGKRVNVMLRSGFIDEVKGVAHKYGIPPETWDAIGYKLVLVWLKEGQPGGLEYIQQSLVNATRQYAKRQRAWFKRDPHIKWVGSSADAHKILTTFLQQNK